MRVAKLAVFRGLYLGDLVAATPALRALRRGYPGAEISLVSLPWATALTPHLPHIDRLLPYPGAPGLDGGGNERDLEAFLVRMRAERFDLAVNMHGRGPTSTRLVARFDARRTASFVGDKDSVISALDVAVPWDAEAHESHKLLLLAEKAGGALTDPEPELRVREEDYRQADALLPDGLREPLALVHPGASVLEKRWPGEAFGRVAEGLIRQGYTVAVTGSAAEKGLTRRVSEVAPGSLDLGGETGLSTLIVLVARAGVLISNDTGPAHLAYALKTPSVTLFGPSTDAGRWGPLNQERHAVLHGDPISDVPVGEVLRSIDALTVERTRVGA
ncbi:MAG: glycosyltransferase family 9 protein [Actinobacteria bacterium]|nr:glycosyltransferase family 9 protein [Actinomycetota bacterium]MCA1740221.1 glycosyltransferase family 9 protein [Actinomycetota bacterium]